MLSKDHQGKPNRLAKETSPYLLQHAHNPVNWFPWRAEAFQKAKNENKPIFLSIGYSTCHWCHVMEHESFEDDSVAKLLNDWFISIKVDREEMPEIDHVYMSVCQAMTGSGGWPLTIVMTPDKQPFFAGTYFPRDQRGGRPGLFQLLPVIHDAWMNKSDAIMKSVNDVQSYLIKANTKELGKSPEKQLLDQAFNELSNRFDQEFGGFGNAPKFPSPHILLFLLRYYNLTHNAQALVMVESTLKKMRLGGIFDQVGFGFHRYSTDKIWLVPHFEKMLYDQAMLIMAYSETYQITKNEFYANTAREIIAYVLRDMTSPDGGFYSAEDADSEGEEGKFYLWTEQEIKSILDEKDGSQFNQIFNVYTGGNFHEEATGEQQHVNILHLKQRINLLAESMKINPKDLEQKISTWRGKLFSVREKRIHPLKDDKILTDWNGLMIAALSKASVALNEPAYMAAAKKAADFILTKNRTKDGRLLKRVRTGSADLDGHLDDYAFMIWGMLELYRASLDPQHLKTAVGLSEMMTKDFWNQDAGGFFIGADQSEKLIVRSMDSYDGAIPSGNSAAVNILNQLARITGNMDWADKAEKTLQTFAYELTRSPSSHAHMLSGFMFDLNAKEVVVVGDRNSSKKILDVIQELYQPNMILIFKEGNTLSESAPWTNTLTAKDNAPTIYVCKNFACNLPTTDLQTALQQIKN